MLAPEPPPTEPMLDGRYRLGRCVGQGGMARVYRGEDVILGRTVAIKMFEPGADRVTTLERARSETTVLASLSHPSLVTLFDAQLAPGRPEYMVMEFVGGPTLSARMASGPLPSAEVAHFAAGLAEALYVVHLEGVVHRDIKPSNILLAPSHLPGGRSRAKLADFGIARVIDTSRLTTPGIIIGTAAYIAPEQLRGAEPSPAADIYSLGLVLLEALTGQPAFPEAEGIGTAFARLAGTPTIPDSVGPHWSRLLTDMTATDPEHRPTAAEVAATALEFATAGDDAALRPMPVRAAPSAAVARGPEPSAAPTLEISDDAGEIPQAIVQRRSRRSALAGVVAAAAAVTAIIAGVWVGTSEGSQSPAATSRQQSQTVFDRLPIATNPTDEVPAPVPATDDTGTVVPADTTTTDDSGQQAKTDQEQKKADRDAQKAAEAEQREQAKADKKAEQESEKEKK